MAADAEPDADDSEIIAVLRLWADEMDDIALAAFDHEVIRLARLASPRLAVVATEALAGSDARLRVAAAFALGRCSELAELGLSQAFRQHDLCHHLASALIAGGCSVKVVRRRSATPAPGRRAGHLRPPLARFGGPDAPGNRSRTRRSRDLTAA